jgi:hypothetical protein
VHGFTKDSAELFFMLMKRNAYGTLLDALLREAIRTRNKEFLYKNPSTSLLKAVDSSGGKYYQDYKEELMQIEKEVSDYHKTGSKRAFSNYFKLSEALDSDRFCEYVDHYDIGQPASTSSHLTS